MRRWKLPLLIIAIAAVYSAGVLFYLSRMPALYSVVTYTARILFTGEGGFRQCLYGLKDMRLEPVDAPEGQRLTALGISFVVDTQAPIVARENGEQDFAYLIGKDKLIMLTVEPYGGNGENPSPVLTGLRGIYRDEKARMLFEKATGKNPDSEYVCQEAIRDATIWDFSPFDNNKNVGVLSLIAMKSVLSRLQRNYRFDNGKVVGLLDRYERGPILLFFSPDDLDTRYYIKILGSFTPTETDMILRTLTLDEPHAKQEVDIP